MLLVLRLLLWLLLLLTWWRARVDVGVVVHGWLFCGEDGGELMFDGTDGRQILFQLTTLRWRVVYCRQLAYDEALCV